MRVSLVNIRCFLLFLLLFCLCAICSTSLYLNSNHVFLLGRRFSSASRAFKPYFIYFFFSLLPAYLRRRRGSTHKHRLTRFLTCVSTEQSLSSKGGVFLGQSCFLIVSLLSLSQIFAISCYVQHAFCFFFFTSF